MRVVIDIRDGVPETVAVFMVLSVMRKGRVSTDRNGVPHFCWASVSPSGFVVHTRKKKSATAADSFIVERDIRVKESPRA